MTRRPLDHATACLRLLAMAVLVLGLLAKPVLVAACELDDLAAAHGQSGHLVDAIGESSAGECCPGQSCGECCSATSMLPVVPAPGPAVTHGVRPPALVRVELEPGPLPVAHRPPIGA